MSGSRNAGLVQSLEAAVHWFGHHLLTARGTATEQGYFNRKVAWAAGLGCAILRMGYASFSGHKVDIYSLVGQSLLAALIAIPVSKIPTAGEKQPGQTPYGGLSWDLWTYFSQKDPGWRPSHGDQPAA